MKASQHNSKNITFADKPKSRPGISTAALKRLISDKK